MPLSQHVESYRFWDIVQLWSQEQLAHEYVVARAMARGVLRDGLRVQSVDPRWTNPGTFELRGAPLVGFVARDGVLPVFIRAAALAHLRQIVERGGQPDPSLLHEEFVTKQDFGAWLAREHLPVPTFWFAVGRPETVS
ncbi:hypothetical protein FN976_01035 [Caenimonas sedimenti]|uniref:Uncharacterized protein n=1 Tax=Caenimonas sedimenti TaxID=2596921 RepID=A0A562ZW63_9BURK|nr:hypothetical protein [Caenimonas sedimenti]TWO72859.1 hypothetical protein FN976_01035 [Caenimonas sedimenti]